MALEIVAAVYLLASLGLFLYGINSVYLLILHLRRRSPGNPLLLDQGALPMVTVQLPIFNERHVGERLLKAVCLFDYPRDRMEIQVLDDSTDDTREIMIQAVQQARQDGLDVKYLHREKRTGYKGGALREGLDVAKGEFIAVFDADFVPPPEFLRRIIPVFQTDARVGMVQARWGHLNEGYSLLTRVQSVGIDGHFLVEQPARSDGGLFLNFNGTGGVWRRKTILDAGNWSSDTLTEDLDLSYRAQLKGWQFRYVAEVVCPGELPAHIIAFKNQQRRWAKGSIQTAIKLYPSVFSSRLSKRIKLEAFFHLTGYMVHPLMMVLALTAPILALVPSGYLSHFHQLFVLLAFTSLAGFIGPTSLYSYSQVHCYADGWSRLKRLPALMMGGTGLTVSNTVAIIEALAGNKGSFIRTPKHGIVGKEGGWAGKGYVPEKDPWAYVELGLGAYTLFGVVAALFSGDYGIIPFLLLYVTGFTYVGTLSLLHSRTPGGVTCDLEPGML